MVRGILSYLGYLAYKVAPGLFSSNDPAELERFIKGYSVYVVAGVLILAALYFLVLRLTAPAKRTG